MSERTLRVFVRLLTLVCAAIFVVSLLRRMTTATLRRSSKLWRKVDAVMEAPSNLHAPCNLFAGNRHFATFPAVPVDIYDPHLLACDLSNGLDMGHRCDVKRGYTFFTFDPLKDTQVSAGMMASGGLYDSHVHAALDVSLKALKEERGITCDGDDHDHVVLDVGSNLGSFALYAASLGCPTQAFEIQPAVACRLEMSIKASSLNVILHRKAVHSEPGRRLTLPSSHIQRDPATERGEGLAGAASEGATLPLTVTSARLDDMFADSKGDVLFMKVDMEDNEFEVLKSAERLLSAQKILNIVVEVRHDQTAMVTYLYERGYACALIRANFAARSLTCRGKSLEQVTADVRKIPRDGFGDIFCCVA